MTTESTHGHEPADGSTTDRGVGSEPVALVVGHDTQQASAAALATAINLAQRLGAHLYVVHSVTLEDFGVDPDTEAFDDERDRHLAIEGGQIAATMSGTGVAWTYHQERGDPARGLAKLADSVDAELIVVGATKSGVLRRLLGDESVSKRLLTIQPRPVVIVPARPGAK